MTEQEWLECSYDARPMLEQIQRTTSTRKLRFFACGCARLEWYPHWVQHLKIIEIAERYADNEATAAEMDEGRDMAMSNVVYQGLSLLLVDDISKMLLPAFNYRYNLRLDFRQVYCKHARDIFGNPFRPIAIDPRWLTSTVVDLASAIYQERAFDRMPILGDALMDAGCDNEEIIDHCRGEGPHVRGCWVVDLLTGRE